MPDKQEDSWNKLGEEDTWRPKFKKSKTHFENFKKKVELRVIFKKFKPPKSNALADTLNLQQTSRT